MRRSLLFWICLGVGIVFAIMSGIYTWNLYYSDLGVGGMLALLEESASESKGNIPVLQTLYNSWIGADKQSMWASLFYYIAPLIAAIPAGWHFSEELHSGYLHIAAPLCGRRKYFSAKLIAAFLEGGTLLVLPQLINILFVALFIPALKTSVIYSMYTALIHGDMLAGVFYAHPFAYLMIVLAINFVFGGLFAWLPMAAAFFVRSRLAAIVAPFLLLLFADSAKACLYYISYVEISPIHILHPLSASNYVKGWVVVLWMAGLAVAASGIVMTRGCRRDIF